MGRYQLKDLVKATPAEFTARLFQFLNRRDEGASGVDPARQNPMAVEFRWGHHHDFGPFGLPGRMGKHHLSMLAVFIDVLEALPRTLDGRRVLDVGCWTGGTSLVLAAMGAEVVALEEVGMYAECLDYLRQAFDVRRMTVRQGSLYDCTTPADQDAFDIVLCGGVLHHVSDPKLALRIMFNSLVDGGQCLLETESYEAEDFRRFARRLAGDNAGSGGEGVRWNSSLFTRPLLAAMLREVGFEVEQAPRPVRFKTPAPRLYAVGRRVRHADVWRGGLAGRGVR